MEGKIQYEFSAKIWQYSPAGGWFFVSVPSDLAREIRSGLKWQEEGWGRLKAIAQIGKTHWETAIWFDTQHQTYLLPVKAAIRKKENLLAEQTIHITLWV